jgi:hypothetical protein
VAKSAQNFSALSNRDPEEVFDISVNSQPT